MRETGVDVGNVDMVEDGPVGCEDNDVHGRVKIGGDKTVRVVSKGVAGKMNREVMGMESAMEKDEELGREG